VCECAGMSPEPPSGTMPKASTTEPHRAAVPSLHDVGMRRRGRERAVLRLLDEVESYSWRMSRDADPRERPTPRPDLDVPAVVERALPLCGHDPRALARVIEKWAKNNAATMRAKGDNRRADHFLGVFLAYGANGVGNLFGMIPEDDPAYDRAMAEAGRQRGWRQ